MPLLLAVVAGAGAELARSCRVCCTTTESWRSGCRRRLSERRFSDAPCPDKFFAPRSAVSVVAVVRAFSNVKVASARSLYCTFLSRHPQTMRSCNMSLRLSLNWQSLVILRSCATNSLIVSPDCWTRVLKLYLSTIADGAGYWCF